MHSRRLGVICSQEVNSFRHTLVAAEAELFNECLMRIYRDPRVDGIHKFTGQLRAPIVDFNYQDETFFLIYNWEQFSDTTARRVTVSHAYKLRDYDEDFAGY